MPKITTLEISRTKKMSINKVRNTIRKERPRIEALGVAALDLGTER